MAPSKAISVELKARQRAILKRQLESGQDKGVGGEQAANRANR